MGVTGKFMLYISSTMVSKIRLVCATTDVFHTLELQETNQILAKIVSVGLTRLVSSEW